jgi:Zn-dependent protease with chaperone function
MNFFEAQARARRRTGWLLLLFGLAVAVLVVLVNLLVMAVVSFQQDLPAVEAAYGWGRFALVALATIAFIGAGSAYKMISLSGGGRAVAEMLGGRLVPRNTGDPAERRLINVVDEMAIASGTPAPPVYLLEEMGINAFAAGHSPNNAVVGVTRGAITYLSRDELQGVMAHEFSHIFNGDMRLNIRLMGVLHGILLIGLTGYYLLRATRFARASRGKSGGIVFGVLVLGLGLVAIGYAGFFFGQWIKAVVSRQREFLADASAVQFTRNRDGIGNALKKIGGSSAGSLLDSPAAGQYSHAYFSSGVGDWMESLFATHPPLPVRIRRIDSRWDGKFIPPTVQDVARQHADTDIASARKQILVGAVVAGVLTPDDAVALIGKVGPGQVRQAQDILASIPEALRQASAEPYGARAVVYTLLLAKSPEYLAEQVAQLATLADPEVARLAVQLHSDLEHLPEGGRLPLADLCLPTLRSLSRVQYDRFRQAVDALITIDRKVDMDEWLLRHFLMRQLDEHFGLRPPPKASHGLLGSVNREAALLVSLAAHLEHPDATTAEQAFTAGVKSVDATALKFIPREQLELGDLNTAVDKLSELKPLLKPRVLKACAACLMFDNRATVKGQELLRTIASCLDSPMPPLAPLPREGQAARKSPWL